MRLKGPIQALACLVIVLAAVSASGCYALYPLKRVFVNDKVEETRYETVQKAEIHHKFVSTPNIQSVSYRESKQFTVVDRTLFIRLTIDATIVTIPPGIYNLINTTLPDQNLEVTLLKPDGQPWYSLKVNTSYYVIREIPGPETGNWKINIYAVGYGLGDYSDSFQVTVETREPSTNVTA
jgi:hypothetical protein